MLPRRFALIRHVDYSGAAGTGVIAYGVAFDDGQVVLRWSSTHRATSLLDSVEDLIAAHGHGEATSIEWIDAPPGQDDAAAQPSGGRRARRPSQNDEQPATDVPQEPKPPPATAPESPDVGPTPSAAHAPKPSESADVRPAAHAIQTSPTPADAGSTTGPVPTVSTAAPAAPAVAQHAGELAPAAAQPPTKPNADTPSWAPTQPPSEPAAQPGVVASPSAPPPVSSTPAAPTPASLSPAAHASSSPNSNGARHSASWARPTQEVAGDDRRRHEAIATQPMSAELPEERDPEPRRPRRVGPPTHESPRSIFEEVEEPARPDLRLASSNGRSRGPDDGTDSGDDSPRHQEFGGYFSTGPQHLDTVTGLLDLPAGLNRRGRNAEQDALASRRNGRHRGE